MTEHLLSQFGNSITRTERAIASLRAGQGVLVVDNENRENEGAIIFSADTLTQKQMAMLIRECSGIVCLCITNKKADALQLPLMVANNSSNYQTAFTITIEAAVGVTTGVSATDRVATIKAAIADNAVPADLNRPGHVFPLRAKDNGVLERAGHTEATVDLVRLAGHSSCGVLCELTNPNGTMARLPEIILFAQKHNFPVVSVDDIIAYRQEKKC